MAVVIPADHAQVTYNWRHTSASRNWSTVIGVRADDLDVSEVFPTVLNAWIENLQDDQDTEVLLSTISIRMGPSTGPTPGLTVDFAVDLNGLQGMAGTPANCALLVRKYSAIGGRANRGRNFWPGFLNEAAVNELGVISSSALSALQDDFQSFFSALGSGNGGTTGLCPGVILHDETSPSTIPSLIAAVSCDSIVGTQRRRIRS